jgi:hypothetical protein
VRYPGLDTRPWRGTQRAHGLQIHRYLYSRLEDFKHLTSIPIIILLRRQHPHGTHEVPGLDNWRVRWQMAGLFVEAINWYGGDVRLVSLPEIRITGNIHFAFSDLNTMDIADQLSAFLTEKGHD